jgi:hypothetical protein
MKPIEMAPLTGWLPVRSNQDFDLVVKIVGSETSGLAKGWIPIAQALVRQGLSVMTQRGRLNGKFGECVLDIRLATKPFYSMGHGCDILVYLGKAVPACWRFELQPGSLLLWDPPSDPGSYPMLPNGVVAYPVPFKTLSIRSGEGLEGKGLAALGALLHLLGISADTLHQWTPLVSAPRSFASGVAFARDEIEKRDAYSLPSIGPDVRSGILLSCEQAILLGYAVSACECRTVCDTELVTSPAQWAAQHLSLAGSMVSVLESDRYPRVQAYRGPQGKVMVLLPGNDSAIASCLNAFTTPNIFVAADVPDIIRLVKAGHDLIRNGLSDGVGVLIEDGLASRQQSVDASTLADWIKPRNSLSPESDGFVRSDAQATMIEREGDAEADIGFVAWGAAQGVVRDAVALCRSLGLNVAGLYPRRIVPFHHDDIESFARTVGRVVIVESGQTQEYWNRLRPSFSFACSTLTPPQGQLLTPMDIFLREGLGAA